MAGMQPLDVAVESLTFVAQMQGAADAVPAPSNEHVTEVEKALGQPLPPSYVDFMNRAGEVLMNDWDLYWVGGPELERRNLLIANEIEREHDESPLPAFLIAFCDDGNGDQYCFDTRTKTVAGSKNSVELHDEVGVGDARHPDPDAYPVVLWDRDQGISQIKDGLYVVAGSFLEWLKAQIHEST
ncbi:MAG: SMI1/KNR4 family protein [Algisphaera sp.]